MSNDKDANGKQVIARAAGILKTLEGSTDGLSIAQITRASGLPRTTVHRLVAALQGQLMVSAVEGKIYIGPAITRLAGATHINVIEVARPHIETLGRATRETVNLSVLRGNYAVLVDQVSSDHELRVVTPVGTALPLYCTAHGKALLAAMDDAELARRLEGNWESRTPKTLSSLTELHRQLDIIRTGKIAADENEHLDGVSGLGCTLVTRTPERYALSVVLPSVRFAAARVRLEVALQECAGAINACFL